jgi:hypothetical protein
MDNMVRKFGGCRKFEDEYGVWNGCRFVEIIAHDSLIHPAVEFPV